MSHTPTPLHRAGPIIYQGELCVAIMAGTRTGLPEDRAKEERMADLIVTAVNSLPLVDSVLERCYAAVDDKELRHDIEQALHAVRGE